MYREKGENKNLLSRILVPGYCLRYGILTSSLAKRNMWKLWTYQPLELSVIVISTPFILQFITLSSIVHFVDISIIETVIWRSVSHRERERERDH